MASATSGAASSVVEYVPSTQPTFVPRANVAARIRPLMRALPLPVIGTIVHGGLRTFGSRCASVVCVRTHTNCFFFRDGEISTGGLRTGTFLHNLLLSKFRPSLRHDRGFAAAITSADDGGNPLNDALNADGVPEDVKRRFMQIEGEYDRAFGYERFWSGAARGLTLLGLSPIHGRGLFALNDIPKGTLVISPRRTRVFDAVSYTLLVGRDVILQAKYGHYAHHTGGMFVPPMDATPQNIVNHSCTPNLRAGFRFAPERKAAEYIAEADENQIDRDGNVVARYREDPMDVNRRVTLDPHALVASRDIKRGEELTIDYAARVAPSYPGELGGVVGGPSATTYVCRCGSAYCRGVLQKGAEAWRFYRTNDQRRAAIEDMQKRHLATDEEFHDDEFVRASLSIGRDKLIDLLYGPLCSPTTYRARVHNIHLACDNAISFLNAVEAERDCRP
jgi:hypothetical protein